MSDTDTPSRFLVSAEWVAPRCAQAAAEATRRAEKAEAERDQIRERLETLKSAVGDGIYESEYDGRTMTRCVACSYDDDAGEHEFDCPISGGTQVSTALNDPSPYVRKYEPSSGRECPLHGCHEMGRCGFPASCKDALTVTSDPTSPSE